MLSSVKIGPTDSIDWVLVDALEVGFLRTKRVCHKKPLHAVRKIGYGSRKRGKRRRGRERRYHVHAKANSETAGERYSTASYMPCFSSVVIPPLYLTCLATQTEYNTANHELHVFRWWCLQSVRKRSTHCKAAVMFDSHRTLA